MIELIYNEENISVTEDVTLDEPKNRKQIGEPREYKKIFIEDYVYTYLLQYSGGQDARECLAILLGRSECAGGRRHLYLQGAMTVEGVTQRQGKYDFPERLWSDLYRKAEEYFPGLEIMGWFLGRPGFAPEKDALMEETHRMYFSGAEKVLFVLEPLEGESAFFAFDGSRFARQPGYYIYYERNEAMRSFIMAEREQPKRGSGAEPQDVAVANFRRIMKQKQERTAKQRRRMISFAGRVAAVALVFACAAVWWSRADRAEHAEVPSEEQVVASSAEVIVEELPGAVERQEPELPEADDVLPVTEDASESENASGSEDASEPEETAVSEQERTTEAAVTYVEYIVQEGDTLAKICREHYGSDARVLEVCTLNEISDGDYIQAGEIILLP